MKFHPVADGPHLDWGFGLLPSPSLRLAESSLASLGYTQKFLQLPFCWLRSSQRGNKGPPHPWVYPAGCTESTALSQNLPHASHTSAGQFPGMGWGTGSQVCRVAQGLRQAEGSGVCRWVLLTLGWDSQSALMDGFLLQRPIAWASGGARDLHLSWLPGMLRLLGAPSEGLRAMRIRDEVGRKETINTAMIYRMRGSGLRALCE